MTDFQTVQRELTQFIRDPDNNPQPADIETRRLTIYKNLFFKNIEGFIAGAFPVLKSIYLDREEGEQQWQQLVRDFMVTHQCHSPYFLEISEEFLNYLQEEREPAPQDPGFMLELAHYEWVELALGVSDEDFNSIPADPNGDLLSQHPVVSPLAWSLAYSYPVHKIGTAFLPEQPPEQPTYLVVYRARDMQIKFMETNAVTARLLDLLSSDQRYTGEQALTQIAEEMQHPDPQQLISHGQALLNELLATHIILGTH